MQLKRKLLVSVFPSDYFASGLCYRWFELKSFLLSVLWMIVKCLCVFCRCFHFAWTNALLMRNFFCFRRERVVVVSPICLPRWLKSVSCGWSPLACSCECQLSFIWFVLVTSLGLLLAYITGITASLSFTTSLCDTTSHSFTPSLCGTRSLCFCCWLSSR